LLALLAGPVACVHIRGTDEQPAISRFRIEGMQHLDEGDLVSRLATQQSRRSPPIPIIGPLIHQVQGARRDLGQLDRPPPVPVFGPILYALRSSGTDDMISLLDRDRLAVDRERVEAYYRDHGYYDARVVDVQVEGVGEGLVEVTMKVEEGQPVRVTRIDIEGLEAAPEARAALRKPALRPGDVFSVQAYDALRDQIAADAAEARSALARAAERLSRRCRPRSDCVGIPRCCAAVSLARASERLLQSARRFGLHSQRGDALECRDGSVNSWCGRTSSPSSSSRRPRRSSARPASASARCS
jgi:hypothetical protein